MVDTLRNKLFKKNEVKLYNPTFTPRPTLWGQTGVFVISFVIGIVIICVLLIMGIYKRHKNHKKHKYDDSK